jgi:hypothetical protein
MNALHLREPRTHEVLGTMSGLGFTGSFHEWQDGDKQRRDERLGLRTDRELRVGDRLWIQNAAGEVRELRGLVARRQVTQDFIDSDAFAFHPRDVQLLGEAHLSDGRSVYRLLVSPPGGEQYTVGLDTKTWLIDQISYLDHHSPETFTYSDYRVTDGMLVPYTEVQSNGDSAFDITSRVTQVIVNEPIAPSVFAPLLPAVVTNAVPASVPYQEDGGLIFTEVTIEGKTFHFLIDSGSQGYVLDPRTAQALGLHPQGSLEIRGIERTPSLGVVDLPTLYVGGVAFPSGIASVVDLGHIVEGKMRVDGVLGYAFFAAAELRMDPDRNLLTIARPGTLAPEGVKIPVDTDRELVEIHAKLDSEEARFIVDTGDTSELLVFTSFLKAHPGAVRYVGHPFLANHGIGGSTSAIGTMVDDLEIGPYHMYNRYASVILANAGAFADRSDGGNIGYGTLRNFVMTFDLVNHALYLRPDAMFNDGRFRSGEPVTIP